MMTLTRRFALSLALSVLATPALMRVAAAGCRRADLDRGIAFQRKDGTRGLARRDSDGQVLIDYVSNRGERIDRRRVRDGVFETWRKLNDSELPVVGSAPPEWTWTYGRNTLPPEAGGGWTGRVREVRRDVGYGDFMQEMVTVSRNRWDAVYSFLPGREVKLSGCAYQVVPVEASFAGKSGSHSRRWVYFSELGLGLETRRDGVDDGIVGFSLA